MHRLHNQNKQKNYNSAKLWCIITNMNIKDKIHHLQKARADVIYNNFVDGLYDHGWDSSAKKLEQELKNHGIVLSSKIYYEYKFPGNLKNYEIDRRTAFLRLFAAFYENWLEKFEKPKLVKNRLFWHATTNAKYDMSAFFYFCICLALSRTKNIKTVFEQAYISCETKLDALAEQIRQLNPELQGIQDYKNFDFVNGAIYGFAPQDIDFYIQQNRHVDHRMPYSTTNSSNEISNFLQKEVTYILSPKTADDILKAIRQHQTIQNQFNDFINK